MTKNIMRKKGPAKPVSFRKPVEAAVRKPAEYDANAGRGAANRKSVPPPYSAKIRFSKNEKKRFDWVIDYVKKEVADGRDFWASLGSAGITFTSDVDLLLEYARQKQDDIFVSYILERSGE